MADRFDLKDWETAPSDRPGFLRYRLKPRFLKWGVQHSNEFLVKRENIAAFLEEAIASGYHVSSLEGFKLLKAPQIMPVMENILYTDKPGLEGTKELRELFAFVENKGEISSDAFCVNCDDAMLILSALPDPSGDLAIVKERRWNALRANFDASHLALLLWAALTIVSAYLLSIYWLTLPQPKLDLSAFIPADRCLVRPKPVERPVFLLLAALLPLGILSWEARKKRRPIRPMRPLVADLATRLSVLLFAGAFVLNPSLLNRILYGSGWASSAPALSFLLASVAFRLWMERSSARRSLLWFPRAAAILAGLLAAMQVFGWRVFGLGSVEPIDTWAVATDSVVYPLSQVAAGKTLLKDLPSQYGLYAEFLGPLWRALGTSLRSLTLLFALLQAVSLGALAWVLSKTVKAPLLRGLGYLALVGLMFGMIPYYAGSPDRAFQQQPLRVFWPALSVLAFHHFASRRSAWRLGLVSAIGALGLLWNFESGVFIGIALGAWLIARSVQAEKAARPGLGRFLGLHGLVSVGVLCLGWAYLSLKGAQALDPRRLLGLHGSFYLGGLGQIELPLRLEPWMATLAVYALAMGAGLAGVRQARNDLLYFLGVLGWGLFFYYQTRAHELNLVAVAWPALLAGLILADNGWRAVRAKVLGPLGLWFPAMGAALAGLLAFSLLAHCGPLSKSCVQAWRHRHDPPSPLVQEEAAFIRAHAQGRPCLILAPLQGFYYAETGLANSCPGPGIAQMVLVEERDALLERLRHGNAGPLFLSFRHLQMRRLGITLEEAMKGYQLVDANPMKTLAYLEPRSKAAQP